MSLGPSEQGLVRWSTYWQHLAMSAKDVSDSFRQFPRTYECAKCWFPTGSMCFPSASIRARGK